MWNKGPGVCPFHKRASRLVSHLQRPACDASCYSEGVSGSEDNSGVLTMEALPLPGLKCSGKYHKFASNADVTAALAENGRFSSLIPRLRTNPAMLEAAEEGVPGMKGLKSMSNGLRTWMINTDGKFHSNLRMAMPKELMVYQLVSKKWLPIIRRTCGELLAHVFAKQNSTSSKGIAIDVINDFSKPLCLRTTCYLLGLKRVEDSMLKQYHKWGTGLANTGSISPKQLAANITYYKDGIKHFTEVVQRVKQAYANRTSTTEHPEFDFDGIIPRLVKEGKVTDPIVLGGNCLMWLLGGFHNPANLAALAVGMLLSHPVQLDKLRTHAKEVMSKPNGAANLSISLRQVVSEVARFSPPVEALVRLATCPITVGDTQVNKGDGVILNLQSANRDLKPSSRALPNGCPIKSTHAPLDQESFDISRALAITSQHVGFGHGAHRCLGFAFGSLQVEVVLQLLLLSDIAPFPSKPSSPFSLSFTKRSDFLLSDDDNHKRAQDEEVSNRYSHGGAGDGPPTLKAGGLAGDGCIEREKDLSKIFVVESNGAFREVRYLRCDLKLL